MSNIFLRLEDGQGDHKLLEVIIRERADLVQKYCELIVTFDTDDVAQWPLVITAAREGGLPKADLCDALSVSWSTVLRWQAGRNAPGQFTRGAMKVRLIELLQRQYDEEMMRLPANAHGRAAA